MQTATIRIQDEVEVSVIRVAIAERGERLNQVRDAAGFNREPGAMRIVASPRGYEWNDEADFGEGFGDVWPAMQAAGLTLGNAICVIEQIIAIEQLPASAPLASE